jgi:hypothetical protein
LPAAKITEIRQFKPSQWANVKAKETIAQAA